MGPATSPHTNHKASPARGGSVVDDDHDNDGNGSRIAVGKFTLRRGDACLACRKRRIRCGGEKPMCGTCQRLTKQCIYENGKSTSRTVMLKDRIAQLEAQVQDLRRSSPAATSSQSGIANSMARISQSLTVSSSAASSQIPRPVQVPDPNFNFDYDLLDSSLLSLGTTFDTVDLSDVTLSQQDTPVSLYNNDAADNDLITGVFDPDAIPSAVRDHLLDLYFSRKGVFAVLFNVPRFYARMTLPPDRQPHPSMLYAMYATGARRSAHHRIRQLEQTFIEKAENHIRAGIRDADRLLDVVRAMALLSNNFFSTEHFNEGFYMAGAAVRLATGCGLHRIPSSVWEPNPQFDPIQYYTLRTGGYFIAPPEDPIDLAERIYAFWAVYEVDLAIAIGYLLDTGFRVEDVTTPFPRPFDDYALGLVTEADDLSINDILHPDLGNTPAAPDSFQVLRLKLITILSEAVRMRALRPEIPSAPRADNATPGRFDTTSQASFMSNPGTFRRLKRALDVVCDQLPPQYQSPWPRWDEGIEIDMPRVLMQRNRTALLFLIGAAYMQLWNVRALNAENHTAVLVARRVVNVIWAHSMQFSSTGYDYFLITVWNEAAMILLREARRLQLSGKSAEAIPIEADLDLVSDALNSWASTSVTCDHQTADIAALNGKMIDRLRAISLNQWTQSAGEFFAFTI